MLNRPGHRKALCLTTSNVLVPMDPVEPRSVIPVVTLTRLDNNIPLPSLICWGVARSLTVAAPNPDLVLPVRRGRRGGLLQGSFL
jgi:hypothetical protein